MTVHSVLHKALHLHFPKRMADLREGRNMTNDQLADKTAIAVKQLKRFETGYAKPTLDQARDIAEALGVEVEVLLALPGCDPAL